MSNPIKKLIVAGGRDFDDQDLVITVMNNLIKQGKIEDEPHLQIVSGMARGADTIAYELAKENALVCHEFPADWAALGKRAGYIRNVDMANFADGLLAFWDGESKGTKHMIEAMRFKGKPVFVVRYDKTDYDV